MPVSNSMSKLSILHIISGLGCGGAENMLLRLLKTHQSKGVNSIVISLTKLDSVGKKIEELGVRVFYLNGRAGRIPSLKLIWRLAKITRRTKPDLIQGWMYHGNLAASLAGLVAGRSTPVVWNVRQSLGLLANERLLTRAIIKGSTLLSYKTRGVIYNSRQSAEQHEKLGYSKKRTIFIPNGFVLINQASTTSKERTMAAYFDDANPAGLILGHAARYHSKKGHHVLFEAFSQVLTRGWDVYLIAVGKNVDENNKNLKESIPDKVPHERYALLGETRNMPKFYSALDLFLSSSEWGEGFPNVVAEAMASGVMCVGTDVGETRRLIGDAGIVVPPSNPTALADGIINILMLSERRRRERGIQAAKKIEIEYGISKVGDRYLELYKKEATSAHPNEASGH